jgi:hypothetical protein
MTILKNTVIDDTGYLQLPKGTTETRPGSPTNGMIRYNTTLNQYEWYDLDVALWFPLSIISPIATGGTEISTFISAGITYRIHAFLSSGSLTVTRPGEAQVLIVAGGGGGGSHVPGGGGAGGLIYHPCLSLTEGTHNIVVGQGGIGSFNPGNYTGMPNATRGGNSTAFGLTALGGGFGGSWDQDTRDNSGGSGGGRNTNRSVSRRGTQPEQPGDSGLFGYGNAGRLNYVEAVDNYGGGGGGGAGAEPPQPATQNIGGNGGIGMNMSLYFGTTYGQSGWFAGGGGGGGWGIVSPIGDGGQGGGGNGDCPTGAGTGNSARRGTGEPTGFNGLANSGGGGGGAGRTGGQSSRGGNGGTGIVLIRYRLGS